MAPPDPVASCTPREMLARGPRTAPGTDTIEGETLTAAKAETLLPIQLEVYANHTETSTRDLQLAVTKAGTGPLLVV